jgi:hypothetical protein
MTDSCAAVLPQRPAFPAAPWQLNGHGLQALFLVALEHARKRVPAPLRVRAIAPGYTLGAISAGRYDDTGTLAYNELIVSPALVRYGERTGLWISHCYVDSLVSQAGGEQIWNLDKQIARFEWTQDRLGLTVTSATIQLCCLRALATLPVWMPSLAVPAYSVQRSRCTYFRGRLRSRPRFGIIRCSIGTDSPLAAVVPDQRLWGCRHERASLTAAAPLVDTALEPEHAKAKAQP